MCKTATNKARRPYGALNIKTALVSPYQFMIDAKRRRDARMQCFALPGRPQGEKGVLSIWPGPYRPGNESTNPAMSADVPLTLNNILSMITSITHNNTEPSEPPTDPHGATVDKLKKVISLLQPAVDTLDALHRGGNFGDVAKLEMCIEKLFHAGALTCQARQSKTWENSNLENYVVEQINHFQQLTQQLVAKQMASLATTFSNGYTPEPSEPPRSPIVVELSDSPPPMNSLPDSTITISSSSENSFVEQVPASSSSASMPIPAENEECEEGLIFPTGVEVGYSESGKKPILLVQHPTIKDRLYVYRYMAKGSYRCISCGNMKQHRYAKLYQGVLYSNVHACLGKPKSACQREQIERKARFLGVSLPGLWELSHNEDPYPYPAYPKRRCDTRSQNPDDWDDLVEFSNYRMGLSERSPASLLIVYDNQDPNKAYEYVPNNRGSFRCYGCMRMGKHVLAKINEIRKVVQSASHMCEGLQRSECDELQAEREQRLLSQSASP
uniref:FLYWCH-type domain-containing protein n=1 Tax=Panagrellus redivivus TaxID=6233 RepID=A0A7E5A2E7_PANRE